MTTAYGHTISCDAYYLAPDEVAAAAESAGFVVGTRLVRAPEGRERRPQASLLASLPPAS